MKEIMDKIEEMNDTEEKYKKRKLEREQERIKPTEYKEENKEEYITYCQEICELEEEDNNRRKAIINKMENKKELSNESEELKRKEVEEKMLKEKEEKIIGNQLFFTILSCLNCTMFFLFFFLFY